MNKVNTNDQLNRMKSLMNYGLQTESKNAPYSAVEYQKVGADGKVYGIVREGTKYYIKSAPNKQNLIKEDFGYIGGFRNRKDNEYTSYANAQKHFDLKMMSLKEAYNNPTFNVESWDLNKKEMVVTEASDKMKGEILRERQIMKNATIIAENGKKECKGISCDIANSQKPNMAAGNIETGDAKKQSAPFEECGDKELPTEMTEAKEVLGWNRGNKDYMDKSHGTEIGDSAPFDDATARNIDDQDKKVSKTGEMKNGVVENHGTSMHDTDDQNKPAVGVGEGPSDDNNKPFDDKKGKQIDEAVDGIDGEMADDAPIDGAEGGDEPIGDEPGLDDGAEGEPLDGDDELGAEGDIEGDDLENDGLDDLDNELDDIDSGEDDLEERISAMEGLLSQIASKLGIEAPAVDADEYGDDDIFGGEDDNLDGEDDFEGGEEPDFGAEDDFEGGEEPDFGGDDLGGEGEVGDDYEEDEYPMESRRRRGIQIYETAAFKRAMRKQRVNEEGMTPFKDAGRVPSGNMNKLDDFGKHPAYQKVVMDLPPKDMKEFPGNYDMNDDSVKNDTPYGEKIGSGAPFEIDPQAIDNAIAEAFDRLKKKGNRR